MARDTRMSAHGISMALTLAVSLQAKVIGHLLCLCSNDIGQSLNSLSLQLTCVAHECPCIG